jgi:hypothetical protein
MATTYTLISSVTVGSGGASSIDFTSIPADYTDLNLLISARNTNASNGSEQIFITLNSSTASFTGRYLINNAGGVSSDSNLARTVAFANRDGSTASTFSNCSIYIPNYAGSNNKSISVDTVTENNATTPGVFQYMSANLWSNSSAITSISLTLNSDNFKQYSTAYLYGISNA